MLCTFCCTLLLLTISCSLLTLPFSPYLFLQYYFHHPHLSPHIPIPPSQVPIKFTIPPHPSDPRWPASLSGLELGAIAMRIRSGLVMRKYKQQLVEMGFSFADKRYRYGFKMIKAAVLRYQELNNNAQVGSDCGL